MKRNKILCSFFLLKTETFQFKSFKEAAWKFVHAIAIDPDHLYETSKANLSLSANKEVAAKLSADNYKEPLLGDEEIFKSYQKEGEKITNEKFIGTRYDGYMSRVRIQIWKSNDNLSVLKL
jgi:hypothetical protein